MWTVSHLVVSRDSTVQSFDVGKKANYFPLKP